MLLQDPPVADRFTTSSNGGKPRFHIAIVGAGLGGLSAAIGISRAGHRVTILEQAAQLGEVGAGIQIPPNSANVLKRWGLLQEIEFYSVRPVDLRVRSYGTGNIMHTQPLDPYCEATYGAPYLFIHRADFHSVLVDTAMAEGVDILLGYSVEEIDFEQPCAHIRGVEQPFHADIIIGADGIKSVCREAMLGRKDPPHLTGDLAYRITVKTEDMVKHEHLVDLVEHPSMNVWMGPYSHAVCYLLQRKEGEGLFNMVLVCPDNLPELVNTAKADVREMRDFFAKWDPKMKTLLSMVQETSKWRLQNSHEMQTWSHESGKFTLLGDACHATLPYIAQGAAMAVEDGAVLGALFTHINHRSQIRDLLLIYENIRKARTTIIVKASTQAQMINHCPDGDIQAGRDRQLMEEEPFEGFPSRYADPIFQKYVFGYDAFAEADRAWATYMLGRFPGTTINYRTSM